MRPKRATEPTVRILEQVVTASVAVTGRALVDVAADLTFLQWRVLVVVGAGRHGTAVSEIARQLGSKLPATSRLVGRLRQRGLLTAAKDPVDARVTIVRLSDQGGDVRRRIVNRRRQLLRSVANASGLTAEDHPLLERLRVGLEGQE